MQRMIEYVQQSVLGGLFTIALLDPKGTVALQERHLFFLALALMLLIVVPVFVLTIAISWRYRASNKKALYRPNWEHSRTEEFIWWLMPSVIIFVLAVVTWGSSHSLDPYQPLLSNQEPLVIQVVALDWKWLFIYPEEHIATVNFVEIPEQRPVDFQVTADAPMNSFWIPQLGSQIYAMPGMVTHVHLLATASGDFQGSSANFSGQGFAGMTFIARAVTESDFTQWALAQEDSMNTLDVGGYASLAVPSIDTPPAIYQLAEPNLFANIVNKYTSPTNQYIPHMDTEDFSKW